MFKIFARLMAVSVFALVLAAAIPTTVAAAVGGGGVPGTIELTVSPNMTVSDKLILTSTVTVTCPLLIDGMTGLPVSSSYPDGGLIVSQVSGKSIAHAGLGGWTTTCDGVTRTYTLTGAAWDRPFKQGPGAAQAFAGQLCGLDPVTGSFACASGSVTQPVSIKAVH